MEGNRTVDVLIPTYKPDQRCVQLVKRLLNQSVQVNRIYLIDTERRDLSKRVGISDFLT